MIHNYGVFLVEDLDFNEVDVMLKNAEIYRSVRNGKEDGLADIWRC
jgi:hypothetical protein